MDILVTCLNYPYPLENGENLRIYNYVRAMRDRHNFDLVCLGDIPPPQALSGLFRRIDPVMPPRRVAPRSTIGRVAAAFSVEQVCPPIPAVRQRIAKVTGEGAYDLIWTSADLVPSMPVDRKTPVLADIVDDMVVQYGRSLRRTGPGLNYLRAVKRLLMAAAFERKYFRSADTCLFVSEVDARVFSRLCPTTRVEVIHNGVDADHFRPRPGRPQSGLLVFEGSMDFPPNAQAAVHFCREILPLIRARRGGVKLCLVGKRPLPEVQALASDTVTVTGFVDDVRPYLSDAAVFVCPMRSGAGIKNKILQAWAMGKAVVATPESTGGLRCEDGENILMRESPRQFADAVLALLADPELCHRLGERARRTIEAHYTWQAKAAQLEALMGDMRAAKPVRYANA